MAGLRSLPYRSRHPRAQPAPAFLHCGPEGGKYIVRGGETAAFYGEPPKPRIAIMAFESMEKAKAAFNSSAYKEAKKVGGKYAKFRVFGVEGLSR
jgi:uncharacterized protein (DUF1330 family)